MMLRRILFVTAFVLLTTPLGTPPCAAQSHTTKRVETAKVRRVAVEFIGGYDTDPRDGGRPVVLIASALGVAPTVFREAFSQVRPAPAGQEPDPAQVGRNKEALLDALGRYGVTNDRLDIVSNYYRYVRERGEMWPTRPAVAYARVRNGTVVGYEIVDGGAGYTSAPRVRVPGGRGPQSAVTLQFGTDFERNGAVRLIASRPDPIGDNNGGAAAVVSRTRRGFMLRSPAVGPDGVLPARFTGDGESATLPLTWTAAPTETRGFALIMHHIDREGLTKWYWTLYNIPANVHSLMSNVRGIGTLGTNSINGQIGYAPPHSKGPGAKTYILTLYALSAPVRPAASPVDRTTLLNAMRGHILATATLPVIYTRQGSDDERGPGNEPPPPPRP